MATLSIIRRLCQGDDVPKEETELLSTKLEEVDRFATVISEIARWLPRWIGMSGGRCRGGNSRSGLSMRRSGSFVTIPACNSRAAQVARLSAPFARSVLMDGLLNRAASPALVPRRRAQIRGCLCA